MSDRQLWGLRGPVRTCLEQRSFPDDTAAQGQFRPILEDSAEYNIDGFYLRRGSRNSDGSWWMTRYSYDPAGRLLETLSGNGSQAGGKTTYSYDDQGRLLRISTSESTDPVIFQYHADGRKIKVQTSRPADYRSNISFAGSPFDCADRAPNLPGGGTASTVYDEHHRAVKVEVRDSSGEVVSRAVRVYDDQGRIAQEQQIVDNPETIIPAEHRARIIQESGIPVEELRRQLAELMAGNAGPYSIAYEYDASNRIKHTTRRFFNEEESIEATYNEQGDIATEVTECRKLGNVPEDASETRLPRYSEARHIYEYDNRGNWVKQVIWHCSSPDEPLRITSEQRRTLTYF
jgi:YD repeat-containing protein